MILSNVNIGTGPSAGNGDPLRTAFNTINENFEKIESNVNALTNSVTGVAGRTGNVVLTTLDIVGINSYATTSYVNSITGGNIVANVSALESNVALIQADINTLYGNAGVQSSTLATLTSNAATQAGTLATLTSNAASQAGELTTLLSNAAVQAGEIASLLSNAGSQHEAISSLQANVSTLFANAGAQAGSIATLTSNAAVQAGLIADLQSNAAVQAGLIASVTGTYSNSNVASYLTSYAGNVAVDYITFTDTSVQRTAYNGQQWRTNLTSTLLSKPTWLSYYPDGEKTVLNTNYGFDSNGMWFYGNADDQHAYPIRTNVHFHDTDVVEIIFTINFANANNDHGIAIFNSTTTQPIWKTTTHLLRIAFQLSVGTPAIYGLSTSDVGTSNLLTGGNDYTFKFTYDPTAGSNNVTVNIYDGTSINDPLLETLSISETLPAGDFVIGFDADQDAAGFKSYYTGLTVRTLTNIIVNDLEVQGQVTGNLIPSANVTYTLGNVTHQWKELWVSGNTIHIGGAQLSVAGGAIQSSLPIAADVSANTLSVADTQITFSQGSYIEETVVVGQPGTYGLALNSPDDGIVGINAVDSNANVMTSVIASNVSVQVNVANGVGNPHIWMFDAAGGLSLPTNGDLTINGGKIVQTPDEDFHIRAQDAENDGWGLYLEVDDGANNVESRVLLERDSIQLGVALTTGPSRSWSFNNSGVLNLAGDIWGYYTENLSILARGITDSSFVELATQDSSDVKRSNVTVKRDNITVTTGSGAYNWTFAVNGNLTVPNSTHVITANATGGNGGGSINITAGASDDITWNGNTGGALNLRGGYGSFADGGGGAGGDVNIYGGASSDSVSGDVTINTGNSSEHSWVFNYSGNLTLPAGGQILDSTGNLYATGGSSYGNTEVATYLPTHTGNVQAGNVKAVTAYRFATGAVTITNDDSSVVLNPDTGTNGLAGVKVGGNGYILGPNSARNITLNYGGVGGAVGLQGNVTVGTSASSILTVNGNISANNISTVGDITSTGASGRIGYSSGGYVIQSGNSSGVSLNTISGNIKMDTVNIAASSVHTVALTNNKLEASDLILVQGIDTTAIDLHIGAYYFTTNTAIIYLRNISGSPVGPIAPMLKFAIIKAPSA